MMMAPSSDLSVQGIVFDLDDTLFPERDYVRSGYHAVAEHLRRTLHVREKFEDLMWDPFLAGRRERVFDAVSARFGLGLTSEQIAELVEVYRGHAPSITAYSGLPDLLGRLHEHYRLGLLSDGYQPAQRLKLEALKLQRFFDQVLFTEDLGREFWKPSPAGFERIASAMGAPKEACAYVADNPAKDFVAPNALGWRTIQYLRPGQLHAAKATPPHGAPQRIVRAADGLLAALR